MKQFCFVCSVCCLFLFACLVVWLWFLLLFLMGWEVGCEKVGDGRKKTYSHILVVMLNGNLVFKSPEKQYLFAKER